MDTSIYPHIVMQCDLINDILTSYILNYLYLGTLLICKI